MPAGSSGQGERREENSTMRARAVEARVTLSMRRRLQPQYLRSGALRACSPLLIPASAEQLVDARSDHHRNCAEYQSAESIRSIMKPAVYCTIGEQDREEREDRYETGRKAHHAKRLCNRYADVRRRECRAATRARFQQLVCQLEHTALRDRSRRCREQVTWPLDREVDEEHVVHEERQQDGEHRAP